MANSLHSAQIQSGFPRPLGERHRHLSSCASTNGALVALAASETLAEGFVLSCAEQTQGRGQRGNGWEAAPGENLTASWLLRPAFLPLTESFLLVQMAALAVRDTAEQLGVGVRIKWPNDILQHSEDPKGEEKKLAGILVETLSKGTELARAVVGVGLNINQQAFQAPRATSLAVALERRLEVEVVLARLDENLLRRYKDLVADGPVGLRADYLSALWGMDGPRSYRKRGSDEEPFEGTVEGVSPEGELLLRTKRGTERFEFQQIEALG